VGTPHGRDRTHRLRAPTQSHTERKGTPDDRHHHRRGSDRRLAATAPGREGPPRLSDEPAAAQTGHSAKAKILDANQTGTYINEQPQVRFVLEVTPASGAPFQSQAIMTVPQIKVPQVQPGNTVDVRYDPEDPSRVAITL
jgi:hypothetical protein